MFPLKFLSFTSAQVQKQNIRVKNSVLEAGRTKKELQSRAAPASLFARSMAKHVKARHSRSRSMKNQLQNRGFSS